MPVTQDNRAFHVDLRGIVDLLSQHLYSSPRIYLRELIQNSVDAITERRLADPSAPRRVHVVPADVSADGCLHLSDTGCGLDEKGIHSVLATIGGSTKRDDLGFARESFLGQFGIGLLSCFLVSDEISVTTRRFGGDETWHWTGRSEGTYTVAPAARTRPEAGTEVVLRPRSGSDALLLSEEAVRALLEEFASYLPVEMTIETGEGPAPVGGRTFPWQGGEVGVSRRAAGSDLAERHLGFRPLDVIELNDPQSGVRGMAFVLPFAPGTRRTHRVYAKGMFVTDREDRILPEWAFFVRAIVDSERLSLTASREGLHDDDVLHETAGRLGGQLRTWLLRMAASDPARLREFLRVHHLGAKAMAIDDPEMLDLVGRLLPWQTTLGDMTLAEFANVSPVIQYVSVTSDFQQVSGLAQSLGLPVLNAGYAYDEAILRNWLRHHPENDARLVQPKDLAAEFDELDEADRGRFERLLDVAEETLERAGCAPLVRSFRPEGRHAVFLTDRSSLQELDRAEIRQRTTGAWGIALDSIARPDDRPAFVLNAANPSVRRLADADPGLQRISLEALYAHALVSAQRPLRAFDNALVARALPALIDRAIDGAPS